MNYTTIDPLQNLPFSEENLLECYRVGAEKFGWTNRSIQMRQTQNGKYLVCYGTAAAVYPANRGAAPARIQMTADGAIKVFSVTQDIKTGTYTIMAQTVVDPPDVPVEKVSVELGDSFLPPASVSGVRRRWSALHRRFWQRRYSKKI